LEVKATRFAYFVEFYFYALRCINVLIAQRNRSWVRSLSFAAR
jgi:hypothetical protein